MTHPTATPDAAADDDDALAEALADEWVARAATDPKLHRLALRAVGLAKEPAEMTQDELAARWGTDRHSLNRIVLKAIKKLRHYPEIQALKPQS